MPESKKSLVTIDFLPQMEESSDERYSLYNVLKQKLSFEGSTLCIDRDLLVAILGFRSLRDFFAVHVLYWDLCHLFPSEIRLPRAVPLEAAFKYYHEGYDLAVGPAEKDSPVILEKKNFTCDEWHRVCTLCHQPTQEAARIVFAVKANTALVCALGTTA